MGSVKMTRNRGRDILTRTSKATTNTEKKNKLNVKEVTIAPISVFPLHCRFYQPFSKLQFQNVRSKWFSFSESVQNFVVKCIIIEEQMECRNVIIWNRATHIKCCPYRNENIDLFALKILTKNRENRQLNNEWKCQHSEKKNCAFSIWIEKCRIEKFFHIENRKTNE